MTAKTTAPKLAVTFVAIGPFSWGKGATVTEAVKNCKDNLSTGKHKVNTYRVEGFNYVSEMGAINYNSAGSVELVDQTMVVRR